MSVGFNMNISTNRATIEGSDCGKTGLLGILYFLKHVFTGCGSREHAQGRGQLQESDLPSGIWRWSSGCQAWGLAPPCLASVCHLTKLNTL